MNKNSSKKRLISAVKKNTSSKPKKLSGAKLAILALSLIFGIFLLAKTVNFIASLTKPFSPDILVKKQYSIDLKSSINIAFKSNIVWVLNYDPNENKAIILKIPSETYMDLPRGYGSWRVGSIYDLGQEEKPQVGSELLKESLAKLLGVPMDGFITFQDSSLNDLNQMILSWRHNPIAFIIFLKQIKTDLTPIETFNLFNRLSGLRSDKIISLNLEQTNLTKSKLLPDSSRVLGVDVVNLDLFIREKMADLQITQEGIDIAVFNATSHPGLAQEAARVITNLGGNPIIISNTENYTDKTIIVGGNTSITYKRLAQTFAPECLTRICEISDARIQNSRAKINIVLGEDYFKNH